MDGGTQLEVLQRPLDVDQGPVAERTASKGRFLAWQKEFLDPPQLQTAPESLLSGR